MKLFKHAQACSTLKLFVIFCNYIYIVVWRYTYTAWPCDWFALQSQHEQIGHAMATSKVESCQGFNAVAPLEQSHRIADFSVWQIKSDFFSRLVRSLDVCCDWTLNKPTCWVWGESKCRNEMEWTSVWYCLVNHGKPIFHKCSQYSKSWKITKLAPTTQANAHNLLCSYDGYDMLRSRQLERSHLDSNISSRS